MRIQFTPDLMPSDITGTEIIDQDPATGKRTFRFVRGPVFSNIVLADEINRTPPKTQAALLQAMQEHEVTVAGNTYKLDQPFFVMATQNPIEQEGTYPLPEAQLDRFMLSINIGYPTRSEEREIVMATTQTTRQEIRPVLSGPDIVWIQQLVRQVPTSQHMVDYAVDLARATRPKEPPSPDFVKNWLAWGAGPRAAQYLILGAKARAILHGQFAVGADDVPGDGLPGAAASPLHQFQRRRGRDRRGPGDREDSGDGARADLRRGGFRKAASGGTQAGGESRGGSWGGS